MAAREWVDEQTKTPMVSQSKWNGLLYEFLIIFLMKTPFQKPICEGSRGFRTVGLQEVKPALYLLIIGTAVSMVLVLIENIIHNANVRHKKKKQLENKTHRITNVQKMRKFNVHLYWGMIFLGVTQKQYSTHCLHYEQFAIPSNGNSLANPKIQQYFWNKQFWIAWNHLAIAQYLAVLN